jgi:hypothetical protein
MSAMASSLRAPVVAVRAGKAPLGARRVNQVSAIQNQTKHFFPNQ